MAFQAKVVKTLTRPTFKSVVDVPLYLKITEASFIGKERVGRDGKKSDKEPPTVYNVVNLESGEEGQLIGNTVIKSTLEEEYPNNAYVGKCFAITKQKRKEGKQYDPFSIVEIEDPTPKESANASTQSAGSADVSSHRRRA